MERGLVMLLHSIIIGFILYCVMVYGLGQSATIAENRSVIAGAVIAVYMIVFGHGLPGRVNPML